MLAPRTLLITFVCCVGALGTALADDPAPTTPPALPSGLPPADPTGDQPATEPGLAPSSHAASPRQKLCDNGDGPSCRSLADAFSASGDYFTALSFLERACLFNDAQSCTDAASAYLTGNFYGTDCTGMDPCKLIDLDGERGFDLAQSACAAGNPTGCYLKGYAYENGLGTANSHLTAIAIWRQNCMKRYDGHSCVELGIDPPIPEPPKEKKQKKRK